MNDAVFLESIARAFEKPIARRSRFHDHPAAFAKECIDWRAGELIPYQAEILDAIPAHGRVAIRGPHGCSKTTIEALAILWFALTRDQAGTDWKVVSTAGAWRQLERYLWPEIRKWAKRIRWDVFGREPLSERTEMLMLNIKLAHGQAFAVASDEPALIEGAHADEILYVFEESKAIIPETFDAAEGAFSGAGAAGEDRVLKAYALACSTPGEPSGRFYDIHTRKAGLEDWHTRHITLGEAVAAGRISPVWAEQRAKQWGRDSAVYANRVLGEFHTSDSDGVIPLEWVEAANARWAEWDDAGRPDMPGPRRLGVDVAREGADMTVLAVLTGDVLIETRSFAKQPTTATTGRVVGVLTVDPGMTAVVDVIGVGGGVVDQLREQKHKVVAFNASESSTKKDRSGELSYLNTRSAAWWCLRERLDPAYNAVLALPPSDTLTGDLTAPHWKVTSTGKIQIESKDDIRKRIGRSTDEGDAVVQACWEPVDSGAGAWITYMKSLNTPPHEALEPETAAVITDEQRLLAAQQTAYLQHQL